MNSVNRTLYIPLYGKACVSRKGLFIRDAKAEAIWAQEGFALKGKSKSKWLAYYMGVRAAVFDAWVGEQLRAMPDAAVIHIGCGLDSRVLRVPKGGAKWYDVDFPEVIRERKRFFEEDNAYRMIACDVRCDGWLEAIPATECAVIVMEGVSMYMTGDEVRALLRTIGMRYRRAVLLMDCYTAMAARMSKYRNPVNDVGVTQVYGMDDPRLPEDGGLAFVCEHEMTPQRYVDELKGMEKRIFGKLYAGSFSKKLYRLFEYRKG